MKWQVCMMTESYKTLNCVKEKWPRIISMLHAIYNKAIASIIKHVTFQIDIGTLVEVKNNLSQMPRV